MEKLKKNIKNKLNLENNYLKIDLNIFLIDYLKKLDDSEQTKEIKYIIDNHLFEHIDDKFFFQINLLNNDSQKILKENVQKTSFLKLLLKSSYEKNEEKEVLLFLLLENNNNVLLNNIENPWIYSFIKYVYNNSNDEFKTKFKEKLKFLDEKILFNKNIDNVLNIFGVNKEMIYIDFYIEKFKTLDDIDDNDFIKFLEKTKFLENNNFVSQLYFKINDKKQEQNRIINLISMKLNSNKDFANQYYNKNKDKKFKPIVFIKSLFNKKTVDNIKTFVSQDDNAFLLSLYGFMFIFTISLIFGGIVGGVSSLTKLPLISSSFLFGFTTTVLTILGLNNSYQYTKNMLNGEYIRNKISENIAEYF